MTRVICVNTGFKYNQWYVDNLKHMIDHFSKIKYTQFEVIEEEEFGGVYDKLQIFNKFKTGQNIYFDLDLIIKDDCNIFLKKNLTVLHAWWRKYYESNGKKYGKYYLKNPINSSVISWYGDRSDIYDKFKDNPDKYMLIYDRGMDEYLYDLFKPLTYEDNLYYSYKTIKEEKNYPICIFNQSYEYMRTTKWCQKFLLQSQ